MSGPRVWKSFVWFGDIMINIFVRSTCLLRSFFFRTRFSTVFTTGIQRNKHRNAGTVLPIFIYHVVVVYRVNLGDWPGHNLRCLTNHARGQSVGRTGFFVRAFPPSKQTAEVSAVSHSGQRKSAVRKSEFRTEFRANGRAGNAVGKLPDFNKHRGDSSRYLNKTIPRSYKIYNNNNNNNCYYYYYY